ncbi:MULTISPECIES: hypothetical protein [Sinorhizobium]|uniref:Lipoprotein n=1 Tax=Sinorhizobium americanum TaxID=194963 RepID=A0A2S3YGS7_9HYPH|nr:MULTISPECIES: hypothetical protein [Sinorhizobium]PDT40346.1 hypothetical protein CO656_16670 [Sinorhizobium sp. FG01]POH25579.1 hypothetical protein ATY31_26340 [Sinorhizobium americanum]
MKRILVFAAALALSATAASAACLGHNTTASADPVDKEITTASVTETEQSKPADELLLQQRKLQQDETTAEE